VRLAHWPIDFIGADQPAFAPSWAHWIIDTWGYHQVYRGTGSTEALRASEAILSQNGVLGIFLFKNKHSFSHASPCSQHITNKSLGLSLK
jgi:hypothetical protein